MNQQDIIFIINPIAGGAKKNIELLLKSLLAQKNIKTQFLKTLYKKHAFELAKEYLAKGYTHFVAVGGDGTVNEVATALLHTNAVLSIIPVGSGNGLARMLQIPLEIENALEVAIKHNVKKIDAGTINEFPFFCTAGIGFDAYCAYIFDQNSHKRGLANYIKVALNAYFKFKPIEIAFENKTKKVFSLTIGNANQFGNNAYITPDAKIDDGLLDCSVILPHSKIYGPVLAYLMMSKKLRNSKHVDSYSGKSFSVEIAPGTNIHLDGEPFKLDATALNFNILELSLAVTVK